MKGNLSFSLAFLYILLSINICAAEKKMLLVGGALKICSSYDQGNCLEPVTFNQEAYKNALYSVTREKIKAIQQNEFATFQSVEKLRLVNGLLNKYLLKHQSTALTRQELVKLLDDLQLSQSRKKGHEILNALSDVEHAFLFQTLQLPVADNKGKALTEYVILEQSHPASQQIISRFVKLVKDIDASQRPLILISTASSNDVFESVSFYLQLFQSFEVDVAWLPIEASLFTVLNNEKISCSLHNDIRSRQYGVFNREVVHPDLSLYQKKFCENPVLFTDLVNRASGLFINGGDQFLTLSSLANTKDGQKIFGTLYQKIKQRYDAGELVVAGTSAGSAVQSGGFVQQDPIPMITNGDSIQGLFQGSTATTSPPLENCEKQLTCDNGINSTSLTTFSAGGLELISIGIFDTHFSARNRAFRMSRLLADNQISTGIGIDENTALEIHSTEGNGNSYKVFGQNAVWWFDASDINFTVKPLAIGNLKINIFPSGSEFSFVENRDLIFKNKIWQPLAEDILGQLLSSSISQKKTEAQASVSYASRNAHLKINIDTETYPFRFRLDITEY